MVQEMKKECKKVNKIHQKSSLDSTSNKNIRKVRNISFYTKGPKMGASGSRVIPAKFGVHVFEAGAKDVSNIGHVKEH